MSDIIRKAAGSTDYNCALCGVFNMHDDKQLQNHLDGNKHKINVSELYDQKCTNYCRACDRTKTGLKAWVSHLKTKKHVILNITSL